MRALVGKIYPRLLHLLIRFIPFRIRIELWVMDFHPTRCIRTIAGNN